MSLVLDHIENASFEAHMAAAKISVARGIERAKPADVALAHAYGDAVGLYDDYASFGQQILDIAQAQRKPMVRPDGMGDDGARKTEALQARL